MDRVLDLLDPSEEDAKVISEMIQDYRERKMTEMRPRSTVKEWIKP